MVDGKEAHVGDLRDVAKDTKMNLLTNFEGTILAIAQMEGKGDKVSEDGWRRVAENEIKEALEALQEAKEDIEGGFLDKDEASTTGVGLIHGAGDVHKYGVSAGGEVRFSAHHADEEAIAKAKKIGFETY